jgi:prophage regulatory protein
LKLNGVSIYDSILRMKAMTSVTGLSKASIYNRISKSSKYYDDAFPKPIKLGQGRAIGFIETEVNAWINSKASERGL